jgi:predicted aldo/keto reductase-like oxidoreductase
MSTEGAFKALKQAKREGKVKHIGITIHRSLDVMKKAIESGNFETIMVLYNPLDEEKTESEILPLSKKHNMGLIVMKALSGGALTSPFSDKERDEKYLSSKGEWFDPIVRGSIHYVISNSAVSTVIPGMRYSREVEENIKISDMDLMTEEEKQVLIKEIGKLKKTYKYNQRCLNCGYCLDVCSANIQIPDVFRTLYVYQQYPKATKHIGIDLYTSLDPNPEDCIECNKCIEKCPAAINIPARLKETIEFFRKI